MLTKASLFAIIGLLWLSKLKFYSGDDEVPLVRVKQGLIRGIEDKSLNGRQFYSYMSIPYAQPPEKKLRFKDPVPFQSWNEVLDGTKMPTPCLQTALFNPPNQLTLIGKEDCLYLNVFSPKTNPKEKLPVMVYIHGGGFIYGSAQDYQPYVLMDRDIVLVVIQYRFGIFGFLSTEDSVMPGNMGFKDQQLALRWVKENIESFGGDSDRITIFGESAGGASVHYQVLSPGSKGLFNRAIIQSGTALAPWASAKNHRKFAIETGQEFNCSIDHGSEKFLECIQNVDPHYLTIAAVKTDIMWLGPLFVLPRVDGEFIEEAPEILMKKGKYNKVDVIQGITRDEGGFDILFDILIPDRREKINKNFEKLGPLSLWFHDEENAHLLARDVYQYYLFRNNIITTDKDWREIVEMNTDSKFRVSHDIVTNLFSSDPDIKVFTYMLDYLAHISFDHMIPGFDEKKLIPHGADLTYLFYGGELLRMKLEHEDDLKMREIFLDLWTNFAKTGNPTPSGSDFIWKEATPDSFRHLSLTTSPVMKDDDFRKKRKFWASLETIQNSLLRNIPKDEL